MSVRALFQAINSAPDTQQMLVLVAVAISNGITVRCKADIVLPVMPIFSV
jgi:hypothetical protein